MASVVAPMWFFYRKPRATRWISAWLRKARFNVFLWHIEEQRWILLSGRALSKKDAIEFFERFERISEAVPILWPVGVEFPGVHSLE